MNDYSTSCFNEICFNWTALLTPCKLYTCPDPESFFRGGPSLTTFFFIFLVDKGREDLNTCIYK